MANDMEGDAPTALSYDFLSRVWRKGFRNGNLRKLSRIERALYMASLSLAKMRGRIVNSRLVLQLLGIVSKLRETVGGRLILGAYRRAMELYNRYASIGLFDWAPQVKAWFQDPSYVLWVGLCSPEPFPC
ncbi:MAG: hypothetical protein JTT11_09095 [Candidatus Brockarchaeota archaeon]|nr:hypothetical protein [Candidatus Brockarchaeota archaeon]